MNSPSSISQSGCVPRLPRVVSWEEWEAGRAARRAAAMRITGGKILRRVAGNPRKDRLLRRLYQGERGLPFQPVLRPLQIPPKKFHEIFAAD